MNFSILDDEDMLSFAEDEEQKSNKIVIPTTTSTSILQNPTPDLLEFENSTSKSSSDTLDHKKSNETTSLLTDTDSELGKGKKISASFFEKETTKEERKDGQEETVAKDNEGDRIITNNGNTEKNNLTAEENVIKPKEIGQNEKISDSVTVSDDDLLQDLDKELADIDDFLKTLDS